REMAKAFREQLIDADARPRGAAALERSAREQVAGLGGMNPFAERWPVEQTVEHRDLRFERLEWRQAWAERHLRASAFGPPVISADAVTHEQHGKPLREGGWCSRE